jgi:uncharacterized FAD-dependent dehydrogenase
MLRLTELRLPLEHPADALRPAIIARLGISDQELLRFEIYKRAVDARKKSSILFVYTIDAELRHEDKVLRRLKTDPHVRPTPDMEYRFAATEAAGTPARSRRPIVIGMGPSGLFAGLILAQAGFRPLILERGKIVRERTKDTFRMWRQGVLDTESNTQFGEGGAGTFSDGKLYSQVKDPRHLGRKVLREFVEAGAPEEILYASRPHIGTFRLVSMVERMRAKILALGGEIRFGTRVDDIEFERLATPAESPAHGPAPGGRTMRVRGVVLAGGERIATDHLVLAVGHSARDTFAMLYRHGVYIEAKPFSIGFRIEHPQSLINQCRYGEKADSPLLGAADYRLVHHAKNDRSVYSFCMCPGGTVVAATSEEGRVVTNGMSQYSRAERNANAGIVVGITPEADYPGGPLAGIEFQRFWESRAYELGGRTYEAPGQLVGDFLKGRASTAFGSVLPSYTPGVHLTDLATALPDYAITAIREAIPAFAREIKGYDLADAVLTGVETRTSSPIRITRDDAKDSDPTSGDMQSLNTIGLYPTGEGAGYAGGILSASIDGIKIAEAVSRSLVVGRAAREG